MIRRTNMIFAGILVILMTVIPGCSINREPDDSNIIEGNETYDGDRESDDRDENLSEESGSPSEIDSSMTYEYYLKKEELLADIEQGYIFRMDKTFEEPAMPYVTGGNWLFYVNEENTVNLKIAFTNLFTEKEPGEGQTDKFFSYKGIKVQVVSPDGNTVYSFEKEGEEITSDTSVEEQVAVTPGEWNLKISFSYCSRGGDQPSNLKISAAYENPSREDIQWLKNERLR